MNRLVTLIVAACVAGCATATFQPYEGLNNHYEGTGGTKMVVDGVEIWANGAPPRKYSILGVVTSEVGAGFRSLDLIHAAVSKSTRERGGDAAIQINDNTSFAGVIRTAPGVFVAANRREMKFAVVKYER